MLAERDRLMHLRFAAEIAGVDVDEIVLPVEHHIVLAGLRLHYLDWGNPDAPPLLFLHGGCLTARTWDLVCLHLRADYHCVAVDQRGHGDSEWSPTLDYGPEAHARDIAGLIDQLRLRKPVLVGHSLGGLNAMTYAADMPDQLAGIVLVDVGPAVQPDGVKRLASFIMDEPAYGSVDDFVQRARAFNPRRDARLLRHSLLHNLRQLSDGGFTWKYDRRHLSPERFEQIKARFDQLCDRTDAIACPVLLVRGADSDSFTDAQAASFAASLPDGRWTKVENAGHTIQGDNPPGLTRAISEFLAEVTRPL